MNSQQLFRITSINFVMMIVHSLALATGAGITYQGRIITPSGQPVTSSNVQFRIQIRTPGSENCLMYEEVQSKDMSQSAGVFAVTINDGTGTRVDSSGYSIDQTFANRGTFSFASGQCTTGTTYSPNATDGRKIQVFFNDGSFPVGEWEPTPPMAINYTPAAIEALQIGGYKKEQILKLADGVSTANTELNLTQWTQLQSLISGSSASYLKPSDPITQLQGGSLPTPADGQSIRWNGTASAWENYSPGASVSVTKVTAGTGLNVNGTPAGEITTTGTINVDVGTTAGKILQVAAGNKIPALDGSDLTNVNAARLAGTTVAPGTLTSGDVLKYSGGNWTNAALSSTDLSDGSSLIKSSQLPAACSQGQTLTFLSPTGTWTCLDIYGSQTAKTFLAAPSGAAGSPTFRTIAMSDLGSGTADTTTFLRGDGTWASAGGGQWTSSGNDLYNANTGNVGIGTSVPTSLFQVSKTQNGETQLAIENRYSTPSGSSTALVFKGYRDVQPSYQLGKIQMQAKGGASAHDGDMIFYTGGYAGFGNTPRMTIASAGNIGINTLTPSERLEINGALKLGTTTTTNAGTLRWDGSSFQGYNGSDWVTFVSTPPPSTACDNTITLSTPGSYAYTVPSNFGTITVQVWGGGGAGGANYAGNSGETSSIAALGLSATGGGGGGGGVTGTGGAGGIASGGDVNQNGVGGSNGPGGTTSGTGGSSPFGGSGGTSIAGTNLGNPGGAPGGGASGSANSTNYQGGGGGGGAYVRKVFTPASLAASTYISNIIVGAGGLATGGAGGTTKGGSGGHGRVVITCSTDPAPSAVVNRSILYWDGGAQTSNANFVYSSSGKVGIGTSSPTATLDVNGFMKLSKNAAPPATCDSTTDGAMALTSKYTTCACNGTTWVSTVDGTTTCDW